MTEEMRRILKLLEDRKITAVEAEKLISALEATEASSEKNRFLKVKVWEKGKERAKVNVTLPLALVKWGLKMAPASARAKIAEQDIDLRMVSDALEKGIVGKIVEVDDEARGEHIEVWLE